jgi:DNA-binding transcriptional ArsR family regulator
MRREDRCEVRVIDDAKVKKAMESMIDGLEGTHLADMFSALSDPTRLRIISALATSGELCVCDISASLGMTQSAISHQLRLLRNINLVKNRKQGRMVYYTLTDDRVKNVFTEGWAHIRGS